MFTFVKKKRTKQNDVSFSFLFFFFKRHNILEKKKNAATELLIHNNQLGEFVNSPTGADRSSTEDSVAVDR